MQDDNLWMKRLRNGDPDALRWLYETYRDDMVRVAACLLADLAGVEDCLHDVFVAVAGGAGRLAVRGSVRAYLVTCMVNRVRARRQSLREAGTPDVDQACEATASHTEDAVHVAIRREEQLRLYQAMARLPYEQREAVTLHLHGQMTFPEIAEQLGISVNTAQSRYRYALEKLRAMLNVGAES